MLDCCMITQIRPSSIYNDGAQSHSLVVHNRQRSILMILFPVVKSLITRSTS